MDIYLAKTHASKVRILSGKPEPGRLCRTRHYRVIPSRRTETQAQSGSAEFPEAASPFLFAGIISVTHSRRGVSRFFLTFFSCPVIYFIPRGKVSRPHSAIETQQVERVRHEALQPAGEFCWKYKNSGPSSSIPGRCVYSAKGELEMLPLGMLPLFLLCFPLVLPWAWTLPLGVSDWFLELCLDPGGYFPQNPLYYSEWGWVLSAGAEGSLWTVI